MTEEGKVKKEINKVLAKFGDKIWHYMPVPYGFGKPALDYLMCVSGSFIAIEAKAGGEVPTPLQEKTIREMRAAGGKVFVIDGTRATDTYESLERYLTILCNFRK